MAKSCAIGVDQSNLGQAPSVIYQDSLQIKSWLAGWIPPASIAVVIGTILLGDPTQHAVAQNLVMTPVLPVHVGKHPEGLAVGDFNKDGHFDIATANSDSDDVTILLGNGNGTFRAGVSFGVGKSPLFLTAGFVNQDEILDLVVAETGADGLVVLLGKGDGLFHSPVSYPSGKGPTFIAIADIDGDRDLDLVAVNSGRFGNYPPFSLSVLLNQGDGRFGAARTIAENGHEGLFPTGVSLADRNGDGLPDLAVTWSQPSWRTPAGVVRVFVNRGKGAFTLDRDIQAGMTLSALTQADLDNDGQVDLVAASVFTDSLMVLLQLENNRYTKPAQLGVGFSPVAVRINDLDGDGQLDLVATNRASNSVSVLLGMGYGSFRAAGHFSVGLMPTALGVQDFNEDGLPDIVTVNSGSDDVSILLSGKTGIPSLTLSAESFHFDRPPRDVPSPKSLTLSNVGLAPLTISRLVLEGPNSDSFELTYEGCAGSTLTTGKLCVVEIRFTAQAPGTHHAQLTIWDNAPGSPRLVILSGTVKG
ncbi:MAG: FG-GAP-like repeat-containing protein [Nitrospirota bacterium]|nr:FG-GAP-like repeat-containing protein [Nitrospirota bacterium]